MRALSYAKIRRRSAAPYLANGLRSNLDQPPSVNSIHAVTRHNAECVWRNSICARLFGEDPVSRARLSVTRTHFRRNEGKEKEEVVGYRRTSRRRVPIRAHCLYFVAQPSGAPAIDPADNRTRQAFLPRPLKQRALDTELRRPFVIICFRCGRE